jgi:hypothetical protein
MAKQNFLLGKGERLTQDVVVRSGGGPKITPYSFQQARSRLAPMLDDTVRQIRALPDQACPQGQAVAAVVLNPEFIAKSYFPSELFRQTGLTPVGSKPRRITPAQRSKGRTPEEALTTELFVMGTKQDFANWQSSMGGLVEGTQIAKDLMTLETIEAQSVADKIKGIIPARGDTVFEVVLHTEGMDGERAIIQEFSSYLRGLGVNARLNHRFYAGGLCFVELEAPAALAESIALFSIVRAVRQMPQLRILQPAFRTSGIPSVAVELPPVAAVDASINVAIFDGGLPASHPLSAWASPYEIVGTGPAVSKFLDHGTGVTLAFLFGSIDPSKPLPQPYSNVDHYRVLDGDPSQNLHELYEVLGRIMSALDQKHYDFVNLSIGPSLTIEDDDVHAWTAVLDDRFARADTLAAVAVGNNGEGDEELSLNRVQVPSDCVNALAVGAADSPDETWARAPYSSVGPGRSPGLMKPDLVQFGGSLQRPFLVVGGGSKLVLEATGGTSFAAPSTLRLGAGIRAHFGNSIGLLAVRTLLIHSTEASDHPHREIGWGRVAQTLEDIVVCDNDTIRVIYQGDISPTKYIRAPIPLPEGGIIGNAEITATMSYKCLTDPHHPGNYTRAGLDVTFRPHDGKFKSGEQLHADSKSFFSSVRTGGDEEELRRDAWKWENCLHATRKFRGSSLQNPCFDIHYNARLEGRNFTPTEKLPYALAVTVRAKGIADFYDQVVRKYATQLEPLRPVIEIPVRT